MFPFCCITTYILEKEYPRKKKTFRQFLYLFYGDGVFYQLYKKKKELLNVNNFFFHSLN